MYWPLGIWLLNFDTVIYKDLYNIDQYIHWRICQYYTAVPAEELHENHPKQVIESHAISTRFGFSIHTDRHLNQSRRATLYLKATWRLFLWGYITVDAPNAADHVIPLLVGPRVLWVSWSFIFFICIIFFILSIVFKYSIIFFFLEF